MIVGYRGLIMRSLTSKQWHDHLRPVARPPTTSPRPVARSPTTSPRPLTTSRTTTHDEPTTTHDQSHDHPRRVHDHSRPVARSPTTSPRPLMTRRMTSPTTAHINRDFSYTFCCHYGRRNIVCVTATTIWKRNRKIHLRPD